MSGIQVLRKSRALALGIALAAGAGGYAISRATPSVAAGGHSRASIRIADPSEGPSKLGFAPFVKQVLPNVENISSSNVVLTPNHLEGKPSAPVLQPLLGQNFHPGP